MPNSKHRESTCQWLSSASALFNCTFFLSWGTDALTGAMIEYSPASYFVELPADGVAQASAERQLMLFVVSNHSRLFIDIARGEGEYLRAVAAIGGVRDEDLGALVNALRARLPEMAREEYPERVYVRVLEALSSLPQPS